MFMGFFSNLFKVKEPVAPPGHPFPELYPFELKCDAAIQNKKNAQMQLPIDLLTKEKWDYLSSKYWQLQIPVTHEFHKSHDFYLRRFNSVREDILSGNQLSIDKTDEEYIGAFVEQELPGSKMNIVKPTIIKTGIAGFRFHDYKKKDVKEMLTMDPFQQLDTVIEPDNKFDIHAVKLLWEGYMLGYVPREYSSEVTKALECNKEVTCYLESYDNFGSVDDRTHIEIRIDHAKTPSSR
ncbi:HIRAN domain-containing protein [Dyadobacter sp. CY312]|uniref:HIRAN domain-containing protein n=1 Tax=Dyadobacter sp. CY312 TaxID=2907303 RepID=UPI001F442809|nr:HIRAN domain-containing protein [Dyadobacter sp. CY312]MCE7040085.1 HIRAN domain-containing protein [Dyadobacter sp. CY312]